MDVTTKRMIVWLFLLTGSFQTGLGSTAEQMYQKMWFLPGRMRKATCCQVVGNCYCLMDNHNVTSQRPWSYRKRMPINAHSTQQRSLVLI